MKIQQINKELEEFQKKLLEEKSFEDYNYNVKMIHDKYNIKPSIDVKF